MPTQYEDDGNAAVVFVALLVAGLVAIYLYLSQTSSPTATTLHHNLPVAHAVPVATTTKRRASSSTFHTIQDNYSTVAEVQQALRKAGLESSDLIVGIDFTASNKWQGEKSFQNKCLHETTGGCQNPYQQVIAAMGRCLEDFDDDHMIPAFGFGDSRTRDKSIFPLKVEGSCHGFQEVLTHYVLQAKSVELSGPTNFAPLISAASKIAAAQKAFHILLIIADGQVTSKRQTIESIVAASEESPLSIIMVGVGDGPWETMNEFDDELPTRAFDNFQFVDFNLHYVGTTEEDKVANFCKHCLMEVPEQFQLIRKLGLLDWMSADLFIFYYIHSKV